MEALYCVVPCCYVRSFVRRFACNAKCMVRDEDKEWASDLDVSDRYYSCEECDVVLTDVMREL